jgi:hypothetical protein
MAWYDFALRTADRLVRAAEDAVATLGDAIESVGEEIAEAEIGISGRERRRRRRQARRRERVQGRRVFQARLEERRRRQREAKGKPPRKPRKRRKAQPLPPLPPRPTPTAMEPYRLLYLDRAGTIPSNPDMVEAQFFLRAWDHIEPGHETAESLMHAGISAYVMAYAYWFDDREKPYALYVEYMEPN